MAPIPLLHRCFGAGEKAERRLNQPGTFFQIQPADRSATRDEIIRDLGEPLLTKKSKFTTAITGLIRDSNLRPVDRAKVTWLTYGYLSIAIAKQGDPANGVLRLDCLRFYQFHEHKPAGEEAAKKISKQSE